MNVEQAKRISRPLPDFVWPSAGIRSEPSRPRQFLIGVAAPVSRRRAGAAGKLPLSFGGEQIAGPVECRDRLACARVEWLQSFSLAQSVGGAAEDGALSFVTTRPSTISRAFSASSWTSWFAEAAWSGVTCAGERSRVL